MVNTSQEGAMLFASEKLKSTSNINIPSEYRIKLTSVKSGVSEQSEISKLNDKLKGIHKPSSNTHN